MRGAECLEGSSRESLACKLPATFHTEAVPELHSLVPITSHFRKTEVPPIPQNRIGPPEKDLQFQQPTYAKYVTRLSGTNSKPQAYLWLAKTEGKHRPCKLPEYRLIWGLLKDPFLHSLLTRGTRYPEPCMGGFSP